MNLHEIVQKLLTLGTVNIGRGPKVSPNIKMQKDIDEFFMKYPTMAQDKGLLEFFEYYSALDIPSYNIDGYRVNDISITILGFDNSITMEILNPDESLLAENEELYVFSLVDILKGSYTIGGEYAYAITSNRRRGIYQKIYHNHQPISPKHEWCCEKFLEWLEQFATKRGTLFE